MRDKILKILERIIKLKRIWNLIKKYKNLLRFVKEMRGGKPLPKTGAKKKI
jgi:hypothetical protein